MMKVSEIKLNPPKILLIGDFGTGKTALALTVGGIGQVLDLDNGLRTAMTLEDQWTKRRQDVDVKICWETDPIRALAFNKAKSYILDITNQCRSGKYPFRCLIVDSYSRLAESAVRHVMASHGGADAQPQIQHWGMAFRELENLLIHLRSLPISVIMIAHTMLTEVGGSHVYQISTPGKKLPEKIPTNFDEVWYLQVVGKDFVIRTRRNVSMPARSRANLADKTLANEGMIEIFRKIGFDIEKGAEG